MGLKEFIEVNKKIYGVEPKITKCVFDIQNANSSLKIPISKNFKNQFLYIDGNLHTYKTTFQFDVNNGNTIVLSVNYNKEDPTKLANLSGNFVIKEPNSVLRLPDSYQLDITVNDGSQNYRFYRTVRKECFIVPLYELTCNIIDTGVLIKPVSIEQFLIYGFDSYHNILVPFGSYVVPRVFILEYDPDVQIW